MEISHRIHNVSYNEFYRVIGLDRAQSFTDTFIYTFSNNPCTK